MTKVQGVNVCSRQEGKKGLGKEEQGMESKLEGTRVEVARMVMVRDGEARHTPS